MDIVEPFRDKLIIDMEDLEVSRAGPSLPKGSVHPLLGKMVQVNCGPFKGYFGHIRNIRKFQSVSFRVELEAMVGGIACPLSTFNYQEIKIMYESFLHILIRYIILLYLSSLGQRKRRLLD